MTRLTITLLATLVLATVTGAKAHVDPAELQPHRRLDLEDPRRRTPPAPDEQQDHDPTSDPGKQANRVMGDRVGVWYKECGRTQHSRGVSWAHAEEPPG